MSGNPVLELKNISKTFDAGRGLLAGALPRRLRRIARVVTDVSLTLGKSEVVGLVGESGCGKSTVAKLIAGLLAPSGGDIRFDGLTQRKLNAKQRYAWARGIQMVFQNPYASLNPRHSIGEIVSEPLRVHRLVPRSEVRNHAEQLLDRVGLDSSFMTRRPHQLSGGQCQRVGIARALAMTPKVLICDEPVSALDVSIQAQVLNLFADLRENSEIAYLFISHDLGVIERLSDRVAVMYLGRIVEIANKSALFDAPKHPYTQLLLASVPRIGGARKHAVEISGERPSPLDPPSGCHFHPRCPHATARCRDEAPTLREVAPGQLAACHLYG